MSKTGESGRLVLCVCTGNVCRSPMAEYILRRDLGSGSGWFVQSAGVYAGEGSHASPEAVTALREKQIDLSPHRSRPLSQDLVQRASLILVMTRHHYVDVLRMFPEADGRVFLMTAFSPAL